MTTPPLFLLDPLPTGAQVLLTGDEGRHAARSRRMRPGELVTVGDGSGGVLDCSVVGVRADCLELSVLARRSVPAPRPRLVAVQALAKGERGELAVELLTELGVDEIVPWAAARSVVQWRGERGAKALARWRSTAREAGKQSRRAWLPVVTDLVGTEQVARRIADAQDVAGLVLHEHAREPLVAYQLPDAREVIVVIGPEGGISDEELAGLTGAGAGPVCLGDPVLRTSTAGAAALAALSVRLRRWG